MSVDGLPKQTTSEGTDFKSLDLVKVPLWESAYRRCLELGWDSAPLHWSAVLSAMKSGHLELLAVYLCHAEGPLDPMISLELDGMITGQKTNHVVTVKKHPRFKNRQMTTGQKLDEHDLIRRIARFIAKRNGFEHGRSMNAYQDAAIASGKSEAWIRSKLTKHIQETAILQEQALQALRDSNLER